MWNYTTLWSELCSYILFFPYAKILELKRKCTMSTSVHLLKVEKISKLLLSGSKKTHACFTTYLLYGCSINSSCCHQKIFFMLS